MPAKKNKTKEKNTTAQEDLFIDSISLEFGKNLLPLIEKKNNALFLSRITAIRRQLAKELGIITPGIRIKDNLSLEPNTYLIKVKEIKVTSGKVFLDKLMAIGSEAKLSELKGIRFIEPTYGLPALWLESGQEEEAKKRKCVLFDSVTVIATQLTEVIRQFADEFITLQDVKTRLDDLKENNPALIEALYQNIPLSIIQRVLRSLVKERVSIRDLTNVLETILFYYAKTRDPELLTEYCRQTLSRAICSSYQDDEGVIRVLTLEPQLEQMIANSIQETVFVPFINLDVSTETEIFNSLSDGVKMLFEQGYQPVILCTPQIRPHLKKFASRVFSDIVVLSYCEIYPETRVETVFCIPFPQQESESFEENED